MELVKIAVNEIVPYENNPRLNDQAVSAVVESIRQCGYVAPIIVDEDYVILAGHTRLKAAMKLGFETVDCVVVKGLDEEQKRKFRILDNKIHELSNWDVDMLREELEDINLNGIAWFDDLLNPDVADLNDQSEPDIEEEEEETVVCPRCGAVVDGPDMYVEEE
jgi:ParB-like chromosome segregation protein Spo0J